MVFRSNSIHSMFRLLLISGLFTGFSLRLYRLGAESLWYDETVSVFLASQTIPEMIAHTARDIHPPGYYTLLHFWQTVVTPELFHGFEFLYAWPSLWLSILVSALLYPIGRRLIHSRVAILAVWLAALNPFHIWYGQEIRMYSLGAAVGMLCLWSILKFLDFVPTRQSTDSPLKSNPIPASFRTSLPWLTTFVIGSTIGIYSLYYYLFLLITHNLIVFHYFISSWRASKEIGKKAFVLWMGGQFAILILWLPWLPIFWKQATNPPVPPWRNPWQSPLEFMTTVAESLSVYLIGESAPLLVATSLGQLSLHWFWVVIFVVIIIIFYRYTKSHCPNQSIHNSLELLLLAVFAPTLIIYFLTATITPLYHPRYLFTYAPLFMLIVASAIIGIWQRTCWLSIALVCFLLWLYATSLQQFWFDPAYRADDHRGAVSTLAANWKPGDVILVNAGWVYTALATYWPTEPSGPTDSIPPPISAFHRMTDLVYELDANQTTAQSHLGESPQVIRIGSIDGSSNLGWGHPKSDFYAISLSDSLQRLSEIAKHYPRIWHYRLYDTVNDPTGHLRSGLENQALLRLDQAYRGRDFLLVQLYESRENKHHIIPHSVESDKEEAISFGQLIRLAHYSSPESVTAGENAYVELWWSRQTDASKQLPPLSMSLRLYHDSEGLIAQQDQAPLLPTSDWQPARHYRQPLNLPVPLSTPPGKYTLQLVVYEQESGMALSVEQAPTEVPIITIDRQRLLVTTVDVVIPEESPRFPNPMARFDYINLVFAQPDRLSLQPGQDLNIELIWQPQQNEYRDTYSGIVELRNENGIVQQEWVELIGSSAYPSGEWINGIPVREVRTLALRRDLPSGSYDLALRVERSSDSRPVEVRQGWWPIKQEWVKVGEIHMESSK